MPLGWSGSSTATYAASNTTATSATTITAWVTWNQTVTDTASTTWPSWISNGLQQQAFGGVGQQLTHQAPETEAQRVEREERQKAARLASERAEELLRDFLTAEQIAQLTTADYFEMLSGSGKRYRVHRGRQGNIYLIQNDKATRKYCIHPDLAVPDADTMLAQKLLLEADEASFLRIANETVLA